MKLAPIQSVAQLEAKCKKDENYRQLVVDWASEGLYDEVLTFEEAWKHLKEVVTNEGDAVVVEEVNGFIP